MANFLDVGNLIRLLDQWVERWHNGPIVHDERHLALLKASFVHGYNFSLWHEEDDARAKGVSDAVIGQVKRRIDPLNQGRNDAIEAFDEFLLHTLQEGGVAADEGTPLHSETAGAIVDRLSIMSLKIYHMREESRRQSAGAAHRDRAAAKLAVLEAQRADLATALEQLLADLFAGRKRFKVYRQMKMYNDPSLNPALYREGRD